MHIHFFEYPDAEWRENPFQAVEKAGHAVIRHAWDGDPETLVLLARTQAPEGGVAWFPALWEDLRLVKCVENIHALDEPWVVAASGPSGGEEALAAAFNAGLCQWISNPISADKLNLGLRRLEKRHGCLVQLRENARTLSKTGLESAGRAAEETRRRDACIGRALADLAARRGPLADQTARVLYVSASEAQQDHMVRIMAGLGMDVRVENSVASGLAALETGPFNVLLCDYVLEGGDAVELIQRTRKALDNQMPYTIILSSSPDKRERLSDPSVGADDIIYKPNLLGGMEGLLTALAAGIYQTREADS